MRHSRNNERTGRGVVRFFPVDGGKGNRLVFLPDLQIGDLSSTGTYGTHAHLIQHHTGSGDVTSSRFRVRDQLGGGWYRLQ